MNLVFTFVGLWLIDRIGRKTLLIIGSFGYIISLSMVAYGFINHSAPEFMQGVESTRSDGSGLGSIAVSAAYLNFELQDGQAILTARWSIPTGD